MKSFMAANINICMYAIFLLDFREKLSIERIGRFVPIFLCELLMGAI